MTVAAAAEPGWVIVTFQLPTGVTADRVALVGDFNAWDRDADLFCANGQGMWVTRRLRIGRTYRFRYLVDGERWENDWQADDYVDNEFAGSDSVVDLTAEGVRRHLHAAAQDRTA